MHEHEGLFCKTVIHWIIEKIAAQGKKLRGPNLAGPTEGKGGAGGFLTMGLAHLQRRPAWGAGPRATEGSSWAWARSTHAGDARSWLEAECRPPARSRSRGGGGRTAEEAGGPLAPDTRERAQRLTCCTMQMKQGRSARDNNGGGGLGRDADGAALGLGVGRASRGDGARGTGRRRPDPAAGSSWWMRATPWWMRSPAAT